MGCVCSRIEVNESIDSTLQYPAGVLGTQISQQAKIQEKNGRLRSLIGGKVMPLESILQLSTKVCGQIEGDVCPLMLCALAVMESCGRPELRELNDSSGQVSIGLLQMSYQSARDLADNHGYIQHSLAGPDQLMRPEVALYFGAAHVVRLQQSANVRGSEDRLVRAFCRSKGPQTKGSVHSYLEQYRKVRGKINTLEEKLEQCKERRGSNCMHVVKQGQTMRYIAKASGLTPSDILRANPDLAGNALRAGDCIALPQARLAPILHVVQRGQSLWSIAQEYEVGLGRLLRANPDLGDAAKLSVGSLVYVPGLGSDSISSMSSVASYQRTFFPQPSLHSTLFADVPYRPADVTIIEPPPLPLHPTKLRKAKEPVSEVEEVSHIELKDGPGPSHAVPDNVPDAVSDFLHEQVRGRVVMVGG